MTRIKRDFLNSFMEIKVVRERRQARRPFLSIRNILRLRKKKKEKGRGKGTMHQASSLDEAREWKVSF